MISLFPSVHDVGPMSFFVKCYSELVDLNAFEGFQSIVAVILNNDDNGLPLASGNFFKLAPVCFDLAPMVFDVSLVVDITGCSSSSCTFPTLDTESAFSPGEIIFFSWFLGNTFKDHNLNTRDVHLFRIVFISGPFQGKYVFFLKDKKYFEFILIHLKFRTIGFLVN